MGIQRLLWTNEDFIVDFDAKEGFAVAKRDDLCGVYFN